MEYENYFSIVYHEAESDGRVVLQFWMGYKNQRSAVRLNYIPSPRKFFGAVVLYDGNIAPPAKCWANSAHSRRPSVEMLACMCD